MIVTAMVDAELDVTVNNIWILGWLGAYDKLAMTRRVMVDVYGIDIDADRDAILYCGTPQTMPLCSGSFDIRSASAPCGITFLTFRSRPTGSPRDQAETVSSKWQTR